jgi:hypothetical protein
MFSRLRSASPRASRSTLSTAAGLIAVFATLAVASPAMAGKPKGEFASFNDCPLGTTGVNYCVYDKFTGGELVFGKMDVPIKSTIVLQGGLIVTEKEETFVETTEGATLSKTAEEVSGGFDSSTVTLTLELVGAVALSRSKLAAGEGTALELPVRAHLKSESFGEECFVGSSAKPITLNLTTGSTSPPAPNKSITGSPGEKESKEEGTLVIYKDDALVENAFAVPAAAGCGGSEKEIINPLVNSYFGLPAAAGHNSAILKGTSKFATAEAVRKSEE